ncbi:MULTISPECIES: hypothetical protein [Rhodanobacter]|uniref:Uncharacterized protein n=2 Tax=Rhodanobacter TaxID=75309 RepID=I4W2D6_9GAMM|nr:hypothetical protein [Rhodanobacter spathiphylli]EIL93627.1 hypothetical protein UU7_07903 [Rhodanobacter spathiphylli B39]
MSTTVEFPSSIKAALKAVAIERDYPAALDILGRGGDDQLILANHEEAQVLMNVARVEMLNASLKYPYWDEDAPRYDPAHEDAFQDVQMGLFEKVAMYLGQDFDIVTKV